MTLDFGAWLWARQAPESARQWAMRFTPQTAWELCPRGDWLLWAAAAAGVPRPLVTLAACAAARTALRFVPPEEARPGRAINLAERWARGDGSATPDAIHAAAGSACLYSHDPAAALAARRAAYSAYSAARTAVVAADLAAEAAEAGYFAARAVAPDVPLGSAAQLADAQRASAYLVRSIIPWVEVATALEALP